jgi:hypothetical protein
VRSASVRADARRGAMSLPPESRLGAGSQRYTRYGAPARIRNPITALRQLAPW